MSHQILDNEITDITFDNLKIRGKLMGKGWKQEQKEAFLNKLRMGIFILAAMYLLPILTFYLETGTVDNIFVIERLFMSTIMIVSGFLFSKARLIALILAIVPSTLLAIAIYNYGGMMVIQPLAFNLAIITLFIIGIFNHFAEKKLQNELIQEFKNGNPDVVLK